MGDSYIKDLWIAVQKEDGTYGEPFKWSQLSRLQFKCMDYDDLDYEDEDYD